MLVTYHDHSKTIRFCENGTCHPAYRADRAAGVDSFGADAVLSAAGFCGYCGTYVPTRKGRAVNLPGLPVWFTGDDGNREPAFLARMAIDATGAVLADVILSDGTELPATPIADRTADRTAEVSAVIKVDASGTTVRGVTRHGEHVTPSSLFAR